MTAAHDVDKTVFVPVERIPKLGRRVVIERLLILGVRLKSAFNHTEEIKRSLGFGTTRRKGATLARREKVDPIDLVIRPEEEIPSRFSRRR